MEISDSEVLEYLKAGLFRVDLDTSEVFNRNGQKLTFEIHGRDSAYHSVRIKVNGKRRKIRVALLVWMAGTLSVKPVGYEVHHRDLNSLNDSFVNLLCLHPVDHRKIHSEICSEVPF